MPAGLFKRLDISRVRPNTASIDRMLRREADKVKIRFLRLGLLAKAAVCGGFLIVAGAIIMFAVSAPTPPRPGPPAVAAAEAPDIEVPSTQTFDGSPDADTLRAFEVFKKQYAAWAVGCGLKDRGYAENAAVLANPKNGCYATESPQIPIRANFPLQEAFQFRDRYETTIDPAGWQHDLTEYGNSVKAWAAKCGLQYLGYEANLRPMRKDPEHCGASAVPAIPARFGGFNHTGFAKVDGYDAWKAATDYRDAFIQTVSPDLMVRVVQNSSRSYVSEMSIGQAAFLTVFIFICVFMTPFVLDDWLRHRRLKATRTGYPRLVRYGNPRGGWDEVIEGDLKLLKRKGVIPGLASHEGPLRVQYVHNVRTGGYDKELVGDPEYVPPVEGLGPAFSRHVQAFDERLNCYVWTQIIEGDPNLPPEPAPETTSDMHGSSRKMTDDDLEAMKPEGYVPPSRPRPSTRARNDNGPRQASDDLHGRARRGQDDDLDAMKPSPAPPRPPR